MKTVKLGSLFAQRVPSLDPRTFPNEQFELWSIPAFDHGKPDIAFGSEIGSAKKCVEPNDVLLSRIVPHIRRSWIVSSRNGGRQIASSEWIVFRGEGFVSEYLRHFLMSDVFHKQFMKTVAGIGGSLLRARPDGIAKIEIRLPVLDEQRRIAAILDQADDLRRRRRQVLNKLDSLPRAMFLELFGEPTRNERQWTTKALSEVGNLDRGVSKHRPRNDPILLDGVYPLIQTGDIANCDGHIRVYASTYSEAGLRQSKLWPRGTLCVTIAANIGKTGILDIDACFPDSVVGFTAGDRVVVEYVQTWMSFIQRKLEDDAPKFAQKNINLAILRTLTIPIPPLSIQEHFAAQVREVDGLRSACRKHLAKLDRLFASLQEGAFRGELQRPQALEAALEMA